MEEHRPREDSDQLPEEGPAEQVPDDTGGRESSARESAAEQAGDVSDEDDPGGQASGNPKSAG
jgi:hypothetical protein